MYVAREFSGIRINFWVMKILWHRERHYVAIPEMAVWQPLACLAPDLPDGWSFADVDCQWQLSCPCVLVLSVLIVAR
jgi:hypothetical protein